MIAMGWGAMVLFLAIFWWLMLTRLSQVLQERLNNSRSRRRLNGVADLFLFIFRAEFANSDDERLVGVCKRLRRLLYGYLGAVGAYIVFLVLFRPHL